MSTSSERTELLDDGRNSPTKYSRFASAAYVFIFLQSVSWEYVKKKLRETETEPAESSEFKFGPKELTELVEKKNLTLLKELGGVNGIAKALKTNLMHGVIHDEVEDIGHRRKEFGANTLQNPSKKSFFQFLWRALRGVVILILIICGSVSLGLGIKVNAGWTEGGSILIGVSLAVIVIASSKSWQNTVFEKLLKDSYNVKIDVVRGGLRHEIPALEIVVGDVVFLKYGDKVPAHGLLIKSHSLKLEEDETSGEREQGDDVELTNPFLFSGTEVVGGFASMLVTSVGLNARRGQMTSRIGHDSMKPTVIEARLKKLELTIATFCSVVTLIDALIYLTGNLSFIVTDENGVEKRATGLFKIYCIVGVVVGLITTVVSTGDPLQVALNLIRAYAMKKLKTKNAMVCDLSALETMNFVDTICINKTGTLTMNQMTVKKFWLGNHCVGKQTFSSITPEVKKLIQEGIALNNISGSSTENAILYWALEDLEMDMEEIKRSHDILHIEAFSSDKKRSGIITQRKSANDTIQIHLKGASESILKMCSCYYDAFGMVKNLDHNQKMRFKKVIKGMAESSLRFIAFAHKEVEAKELKDEDKSEMLKEGMTLLGIVGISNPCRAGVEDAVKELQSAGLNIKMITGDNIFTAKAIATECGILAQNSGAAIEGEQFRKYIEEGKIEEIDKICVIARASPSDKQLMVQCLKQKGHVVAVVGNGTSNSLAMNEADVGIFMGTKGTEVIDDISDIVISDCNFDSIPEVWKWGRCVYNSIQKFIQFRLTANFAAFLSNNIGLFLFQTLTLTALQLLWVSLITEALACLVFATEKPTKEIMKKAPVRKTDPLVTNIMLRNILPQVLFQTVVLLKIQCMINFNTDNLVPLTFVFTSYVLCQVFNQINLRKLVVKNVFHQIHTNKLILVIAVFIILLQILLVEILMIFADTQRLSWRQWGISIGIAALTLPIGFFARFIPVPKKQVVNSLMIVQITGVKIIKKLKSVLTRLSQVLQRNQQALPLAITNRHLAVPSSTKESTSAAFSHNQSPLSRPKFYRGINKRSFFS